MGKKIIIAAAFLAFAFMGGGQAQPLQLGCAGGTAAALGVLDEFMAGFNARDYARWLGTYHFPHVRIAGGTVSTYETIAEHPRDVFERLAEAGWARSAWDSRRIVQCTADKVHVAVKFTRYDAEGVAIQTYDSLYVITKVGEKWGVRARSSFAP
jgi:hypothetical protein